MNRQLHRERGTAAMEMTVVAMLSIVILAMIVLVGRLTWHAIALTKGVANTNRIVATLPRTTLVGGVTTLKAFAQDTLSEATGSAGIDIQPDSESLRVSCGLDECVDASFNSVQVIARIYFRDTVFDSDFNDVIPDSFLMRSVATQTYANTFPPVSKN
jgi:hypothetical protein